MSSSPASKNIYQRMIEVQKLVTTVFKNETVKINENDKGYKAVSHDDVAKALHLPLAQCGIFMLPEVLEFSNSQFDKTNKWGNLTTWFRTDIKIKVKWINVDKPDEFIESSGAAFALDTSDKSFAKAYSLALKIVLLKVHLLESKDGEETREFEENQPAGKEQSFSKKQSPPKDKAPPLPAKVLPKDFVCQFGDVKGKKLSEIDEVTLNKLLVWSDRQSKIKPPPKNVKQLLELHLMATLYKKSLPKPDDNAPPVEDVPPPTESDFIPMPEDEVYPGHEDENQEDAANDLWEFKIPFDLPNFEEKIAGKKLKQLPENTIVAYRNALLQEMSQTPPPKGVGKLLELNTKLGNFLRGVK